MPGRRHKGGLTTTVVVRVQNRDRIAWEAYIASAPAGWGAWRPTLSDLVRVATREYLELHPRPDRAALLAN